MADDVFTERLEAIQEQGALGRGLPGPLRAGGAGDRFPGGGAALAAGRRGGPNRDSGSGACRGLAARGPRAQPFEPALIEPLAHLEKRGNQEGAAELLERLAAGAEPDAGAAGYVRLGQLYQAQLARPARALLCTGARSGKAPGRPDRPGGVRADRAGGAPLRRPGGPLRVARWNDPARLAASLLVAGSGCSRSPSSSGGPSAASSVPSRWSRATRGTNAALRKSKAIGAD